MNHVNFKQIVGAVSVMLSVMFFLIMAGNMQEVRNASTSLFKDIDTNLAKPVDPSGEMNNPPAPENVVSGSFNSDTKGNIIYYDAENKTVSFHYKAIRSEKLKEPDVKPELKLQAKEDGTLIWMDIEWSWIDYDQGILYFHYLTEKDGSQEKPHEYTGSYQLIF